MAPNIHARALNAALCLLVLAGAAGAAGCSARKAGTAVQDNGLALHCMRQQRSYGIFSSAIAFSLTEGDTAWGACNFKMRSKETQTWWKRGAKASPDTWKQLGSAVPFDASVDTVSAKNYGVPQDAVPPLVDAMSGKRPPRF